MSRTKLTTLVLTTGLAAFATMVSPNCESGSGQEVAARYHLRTRTSRFFDRSTNSGHQVTPSTPQIRDRQIQSGRQQQHQRTSPTIQSTNLFGIVFG